MVLIKKMAYIHQEVSSDYLNLLNIFEFMSLLILHELLNDKVKCPFLLSQINISVFRITTRHFL